MRRFTPRAASPAIGNYLRPRPLRQSNVRDQTHEKVVLTDVKFGSGNGVPLALSTSTPLRLDYQVPVGCSDDAVF
jgi:hypothetical protein